ncbi:calpain family cysteine protease [Nitzschia inconspicua]|uniref:Calpain family cysteine protease n=1 Tax=Nitzschia inconspicua TaxID=303405 RepID=A0A9K3Q8Q6_9STRA|nr:calpain family cysteine protease [Nitzschia inconspicua]
MLSSSRASTSQPRGDHDVVMDDTYEPFGAKMKRMATNCGYEMGLCCFKTQKQSQISALEFKINQRKKKFGVDYLTLVNQHATPTTLRDCLKQAQNDISELQANIDKHLNLIDDKEQEINEKIVGDPTDSTQGIMNGSGSSKREKKKQVHESNVDTDILDNESFPSSSNSSKLKKAPPASKVTKPNTKERNKITKAPTGFKPAVIPAEFQNADQNRWKIVERNFNGQTTYVTRGEQEVVKHKAISEGINYFRSNPGLYVAMMYQTKMIEWPTNQHQYTLIHRAGTVGYMPTGVSAKGWMTMLINHYERLPPMKDNILPSKFCDAYTDSMTHQGKQLHSSSNKPILPGRGMGVGDSPSLKIIGDVDPSDIHQGTVGDCWLLSGISSLAEFDGAIKRLFRKTSRLDERPLDTPNQYIVTLWDLSTWKEVDVVIDERLPVMADGSGRLLASKPSEDGELWAVYLEKALSIHCGGWDKITGGQCTHAWALLTGCKHQYTISKNSKTGKFVCTAKYNPREKKWAKHGNSPHDCDSSMWRVEWPEVGGGGSMDLELTEDELFLRMVAWDETNYIVGAGTLGSSDKNRTDGLVDNHAYSVIESRSNVCGTGIDLLKVRNPWGSCEIEDGEFDDDGPGWDRYPEMKRELNPVVADDGIFWVTKDEFFKYYQTIYVSASDMTEFLED